MVSNLKCLLCLCLCFYFTLGDLCIQPALKFEKHLASKTPYRVVANTTFGKLEYAGCKPMKLWMIVRHGTRTPNTKLITKMNTRLPEIRDLILENNPISTDELHNADLEHFRKWKSKLNEDEEKRLTVEGEEEMIALAERMQSRFPDVLSKSYSNTSYQFKFTATQRTKKSAQSFAKGLFGKSTAQKVWYPEPSKKDPILRFYKLCSKWRTEVSKNPESLLERKRFENSIPVKQMVVEINDRLGLSYKELSFEDIHALYTVCAFETAWNRARKSPWCSALSLNNFKVMEYAEDLKYYWVDGYGHELTYKQACPAFNDMLNLFLSKEKYPKAVVYFTHSGTLLKMLAHMGLYRESTPLKASNFNENVETRKWRVGRIDSFGTNLAFVLYDCQGTNKLLTLHQEQVIRLPACQNSDLCNLEDISKYYKDSIQRCTFDVMCDNS